jgi:hypothetical protein
MRALEASVAAPTGHLIRGIRDRTFLIVEIDFRNGRREELCHLGGEALWPRLHSARGGNEGGKPPATTLGLPPARPGGRVISDGLGWGLALRTCARRLIPQGLQARPALAGSLPILRCALRQRGGRLGDGWRLRAGALRLERSDLRLAGFTRLRGLSPDRLEG